MKIVGTCSLSGVSLISSFQGGVGLARARVAHVNVGSVIGFPEASPLLVLRVEFQRLPQALVFTQQVLD